MKSQNFLKNDAKFQAPWCSICSVWEGKETKEDIGKAVEGEAMESTQSTCLITRCHMLNGRT